MSRTYWLAARKVAQCALLLALLFVSLPMSVAAEGDIGVDGFCPALPNNDPCSCPPPATGLRMTYRVNYSANAELNPDIRDFHVQARDSTPTNYPTAAGCIKVGYYNPPGTLNDLSVPEMDNGVGWNFDVVSQMEEGNLRHFVSFYNPTQAFGDPADLFEKGETWEFSFVYCGSDKKTDDAVEYIVTVDGTDKPEIPDEFGDRFDVPDNVEPFCSLDPTRKCSFDDNDACKGTCEFNPTEFCSETKDCPGVCANNTLKNCVFVLGDPNDDCGKRCDGAPLNNACMTPADCPDGQDCIDAGPCDTDPCQGFDGVCRGKNDPGWLGPTDGCGFKVSKDDSGDDGDGGDAGVPASDGFGIVLMVLVLLGSAAYFIQRRAVNGT